MLAKLIVGLGLAALIAVAYGGSLRNELVFDELIFMQRDARVQSLDRIDRIFTEALWSTGEGDRNIHQYYRPLQLLPLALSHAAFGTAAWPSHLLNLLVHLGNCLLALSIFRILLGRLEPAALAAALFAVHPGYSEAVLWVSDIAGLGATFCTLAVLRLHLSPRRGRWWAWLLSPALLLCGLWFKESGILAVIVVALYDLVAAPNRGWRRVWRQRWRYAVVVPPLALYAALRLHALGGALPGMYTVPLSRAEMLLNAVALVPKFATAFLWPLALNMYHDFDRIQGALSWPFAAGAALLLGAVGLASLSWRAHRVAAFGILWALAAMAPHLLIRWPQLNVFAERYLYQPAIGIFLVIGYACARLWERPERRRRPWRVAAVAVLLVLFIAIDARRTRDWRDEETIYGVTLTQSARAELIRTNLAVRYLDTGRYDEGIALLQQVLAINPDWHDTHHNLGLLYLAKGDDAHALAAFEEARRRDPFKGATLLNLGYLYDRAGRRDEAVGTYLRLTEVEPSNAAAWYNLAVVALEGGQLGNARRAAERVLALVPGDADAQRIAARAAVPTAPSPRDPERTAQRCAAAKRQFDAGQPAEAIAALKAAAWLDEGAALPHHYLANMYYLNGRLAEALRHQREAVALAPDDALYRRNLEALEAAAHAAAPPAH